LLNIDQRHSLGGKVIESHPEPAWFDAQGIGIGCCASDNGNIVSGIHRVPSVADHGLQRELEVAVKTAIFIVQLVILNEIWKSDFGGDVDEGIQPYSSPVWENGVTLQADAEDGPLRREVVGDLRIIGWRVFRVPG
jgi:hypothetical protein